MFRRIVSMAILVSSFLTVMPSNADPWKDESGHGKHWNEDRGETSWWGRGEGYWDGHFKHDDWRQPQYLPGLHYYGDAYPLYDRPLAPRRFYTPPPVYFQYWQRHTFYPPPPVDYRHY